MASIPGMAGWRLVCALLLAVAVRPALAAGDVPVYRPSDDRLVLERAADSTPQQRALRAARHAMDARPQDAAAAIAYARLAIELGRAQADPRYYGHAEAALAPWSARNDAELDWLRALLLQQRHDFAGALAVLDALLRREPGNAPALLSRASLHLVQGRPKAARRDGAALTGRTGALVVVSCAAAAASLAGHARTALRSLASLDSPAFAQEPIEQRIWALTLAAEIQARMARAGAARQAFRRAREAAAAAGYRDPYLRVAEADFLLEQNEPAAVLTLLGDHRREDNALLRLALAAARLGSPEAATLRAELAARYAASRARGERTHAREEARYRLQLAQDPAGALALALDNWRLQREPADARLLLECALAAAQAPAAQGVVDWMRETGIEDPRLRELAAALRMTTP